jgi:hypothetical protein
MNNKPNFGNDHYISFGIASPSQLHTTNKEGGTCIAIYADIDQFELKTASGQFNILGADL